AVIGGILGALALIGIIIGAVFFIRKRQEDNGPPKHKPPPPVKTSSSTDMLNKPRSLETAPLSPGDSLDDDANLAEGGALNGGGPALRKASYGDDEEDDDLRGPGNNHDPDGGAHLQAGHPGANIARGESFVSAAMYV
ncbi:hypothetical protein NHX12_016001, partial [Muraenolepis orangiensis]